MLPWVLGTAREIIKHIEYVNRFQVPGSKEQGVITARVAEKIARSASAP